MSLLSACTTANNERTLPPITVRLPVAASGSRPPGSTTARQRSGVSAPSIVVVVGAAAQSNSSSSSPSDELESPCISPRDRRILASAVAIAAPTGVATGAEAREATASIPQQLGGLLRK